jgi:hypothetical protein
MESRMSASRTVARNVLMHLVANTFVSLPLIFAYAWIMVRLYSYGWAVALLLSPLVLFCLGLALYVTVTGSMFQDLILSELPAKEVHSIISAVLCGEITTKHVMTETDRPAPARRRARRHSGVWS